MMVFLDVLIEPIAPILDFWTFAGGEALYQNYLVGPWLGFPCRWFFIFLN